MVATAVPPADVNIDGVASKSYEYTVRGQRSLTERLSPSGGEVPGGYALTLPAQTSATSQGGLLNVAYTVAKDQGTGKKEQGTYLFPSATTVAQKITVSAEGTLPAEAAEVDLVAPTSQTYHYTVRGQRSFAAGVLPASGAVKGGSSLTLPGATSQDYTGGLLNITYTVNDAAKSGSQAFPTATAEAQRFTVVATAHIPDGVTEVDLTGTATQTYEYTVRGQRSFTQELAKPSGTIAPGYELPLPTTTDNGLTVTYTVDGSAYTAASYPFPAISTSAQRRTIVARAAAPEGVDIVGGESKTYEYVVRGLAPFAHSLEVQSGSYVEPGSELELPAEAQHGIGVSYTVDGQPVAPGTYHFPLSAAEPVVIVAQAVAPDGVDIDGADTKTYQYQVRRLLRFEQELSKPSGPIEGEYELTLPATTDNGLEVSYTIDGEEYTAGTITFPAAGKTPQYRTVVATARVPSADAIEVELQGAATKTYEYVVQGVVTFEHSLEKPSGSAVDVGYELPLPATANDGLTVTYTVDGEAFTGEKYTFGSASAHRYEIVAQAVAPTDVVIDGSATKSYEYTVRGQVRFEWEPSKASGSVLADGYELLLPSAAPNGLQLSYTLNGTPIVGSHTFEAQSTAQTYTLVVTASVPAEVTEVQLVGEDTKTYQYSVEAKAAIRVKEQGTGNKEHSVTYDLSGRPVGEWHRGLVIENGKLGIRD